MNPLAQQDSANTNESKRSGRLVFVLIWFVGVLIAGGFGFVVGIISPKALRHIRIFGLTVFHPTPFGMAIYGMSAVGLVLTILYTTVEIASRFDEQTSDS